VATSRGNSLVTWRRTRALGDPFKVEIAGSNPAGVTTHRVTAQIPRTSGILRSSLGRRCYKALLHLGLVPLPLPHGETPEVELKRRITREGRYLHQPLVPRDDAAAGVALSFPATVTAPNLLGSVIG
jgi:hypothetical protein